MADSVLWRPEAANSRMATTVRPAIGFPLGLRRALGGQLFPSHHQLRSETMMPEEPGTQQLTADGETPVML
jgi:hypothetical protein